MPLSVDLMGVGLPQEQACRLGVSNLTTIAGVGTTQVGAAPIPNFVTNVLATAVGGQTAFVLPSTAELMMFYLVTNGSAGATTALVFPHTNGSINGGVVTTGSVSIAQNLARLFIRLETNRWISFVTA